MFFTAQPVEIGNDKKAPLFSYLGRRLYFVISNSLFLCVYNSPLLSGIILRIAAGTHRAPCDAVGSSILCDNLSYDMKFR